MVQFNLLPDVKLNYIKAERTKRMVMLASFSLTGLAVFIFVLLFLIVNVFQTKHLNDLNNDIKMKTSELKSIPDLDKVLTVQNQLKALPGLHEQKPATSRLVDYLVQVTPADAKISEVKVDMDNSAMTLEGSANSIETINRFVDTLKFTNFTAVSDPESSETDQAFTEVVLTKFGISEAGENAGKTTYSIDFKFNPIIFNNTKTVNLTVPNIISTRSIVEKPTELFEAKPKDKEKNQ